MRRSRAVFGLVATVLMIGGCGRDDGSDVGREDTGVNTKTMYVAHHLVDCVGVGPMKCMLIRETPDAEWTMFYSQIEGFEYEPGFEYELVVRTEEIPDPPADASSIRYILEEVVSTTPMSGEEGAGADLVAGEWRLVSFSDEVLSASGIDPAPGLELLASRGRGVTIAFLPDEQVGGYSGCNQYKGSYTMQGGHSLSFGPLGGTRQACPPPLMELESLTLSTLQNVQGVYVRDGRTLELYGADEALLATFERPDGAAGPHVGDWKLSEITPSALSEASDEVLEAMKSLSMDDQTTVTMKLGEDGRVSGFSGCNQYTGGYETDGRSSFEFGKIAVTMRACVGPGMAIESAYLEAMNSVVGMKAARSELALLGADGSILLLFSRSDGS
ncbi:MAG: META domain-containing protein [Gemmatimonadota bacterium]